MHVLTMGFSNKLNSLKKGAILTRFCNMSHIIGNADLDINSKPITKEKNRSLAQTTECIRNKQTKKCTVFLTFLEISHMFQGNRNQRNIHHLAKSKSATPSSLQKCVTAVIMTAGNHKQHAGHQRRTFHPSILE